MRKLQSISLVTTLGLSLAIAPTAQAKAKVTKPSSPTISAISSSAVKKGKVNVTVTIALPASDGGSKITGSKVSAGGKSCTIAKTKTSCTIKSFKNGKALTLTAKSKNKKGFSSASARVAYSAGASSWPTTPVATVVADAPELAAPAPVAAPAPLTCATGGTCVLGDRGPGGGIVYYVSAANFTSAGSTCNTACRYLEVAPATWQAGAVASDALYVWSTNTTVVTGQDITTASTEGIVANSAREKLNWKIGQGFNNTRIMQVTSATSVVQAKVLAYAGNSIAGQWFIPSMNELNELCKYARGQNTGDPKVECVTGTGTFKSTANAGTDLGGFVDFWYWSSSELRIAVAYDQNFADGVQNAADEGISDHVRPIRAF